MQRQHGKTELRRRGTVLVVASATALLLCVAGLGALAGSSTSFQFSGAIAASSHLPGRRLLEEGKTGEAKRVFSEELERNPQSTEAIRGLAQCAIEDGDDEAAAGYLHQLTKLAPKDRDAWRKLALCASRLGRDTESISAAQSALSLAPEGDRPMSDLITRILTSDMDHLTNPGIPGVDRALGNNPVHGLRRRPDEFDPMSDIPRPQPPDPTKGLPLPGRR
jgi:tetratricopeptide (TPR) repeat protein